MAESRIVALGSLIMLAIGGACTLIGEAELDDKDDAASTAAGAGGAPGGAGGAGGMGATAGMGDGGGGGLVTCGDVECQLGEFCDGGQCTCGSPPPPGQPACPQACTSCNADNSICYIDCNSTDACKGGDVTLACPQGLACQVSCAGEHACEAATIVCPDTYACSVECKNLGACKVTTIIGDSGSLTLTCLAVMEACHDTVLLCGTGQCLHPDCAFSDPPEVTCGQSCDCIECP